VSYWTLSVLCGMESIIGPGYCCTILHWYNIQGVDRTHKIILRWAPNYKIQHVWSRVEIRKVTWYHNPYWSDHGETAFDNFSLRINQSKICVSTAQYVKELSQEMHSINAPSALRISLEHECLKFARKMHSELTPIRLREHLWRIGAKKRKHVCFYNSHFTHDHSIRLIYITPSFWYVKQHIRED